METKHDLENQYHISSLWYLSMTNITYNRSMLYELNIIHRNNNIISPILKCTSNQVKIHFILTYVNKENLFQAAWNLEE